MKKAGILYKSFFLLAITAMVRCCGYFQEILFGRTFGVGLEPDLFFQFFGVALFLSSILSGSISAALNPQFVRVELGGNRAEINLFFTRVLRFVFVMALIGVFISLTIQWTIYSYRFGFDSFPGFGFYLTSALILPVSLSTVFSCALFSKKKFLLPVTFSLSAPISVAAALFLGVKNLSLICMIFVAGYFLEAGLSAVMCWLDKMRLTSSNGVTSVWSDFVQEWRSRVPGSFFDSISEFVNKLVAIWVGIGSLSAFQYGSKLSSSLQLGIAQSFAPLVFVYFSTQAATKNYRDFKNDLKKIMFLFFLGSIVLASFVFHYSSEIIDLIYGGRSEMSREDLLTLSSLQKIAILQLPLFLTAIVGAWAISAQKKNIVLTWISCFSLVLGAVANFILAPRLGVFGIAWAAVCTSFGVLMGILFGISKILR